MILTLSPFCFLPVRQWWPRRRWIDSSSPPPTGRRYRAVVFLSLFLSWLTSPGIVCSQRASPTSLAAGAAAAKTRLASAAAGKWHPEDPGSLRAGTPGALWGSFSKAVVVELGGNVQGCMWSVFVGVWFKPPKHMPEEWKRLVESQLKIEIH